jgi:alkanesulfonate monooxygenase SsuD/methylene tetrahydromethanopterin reductase-like flavin-dependent oxidoreductase (luciferase family)
MPSTELPAVALAAVPGRRNAILELAREIERRDFAGIYCASVGDGLGLCEAIALVTSRIPFGTAIVNLYTRHPWDYAQTASLIHELCGGRFRFGVGVSHAPMNRRLGVRESPPLRAAQQFVEDFRGAPRAGELPPLVLAGLRKRMVALAGEIADGVVFANVARSHIPDSLAAIPRERLEDPAFFVGNMIPTCISDDREAAAAVNRRTLKGYAMLPNYRDYWKEAGYVEEMEAVEKAIEAGEIDRIPSLLSDRWLRDTTLFGTVSEVRENLEAWFEAGVRTPILVPSSAVGNQMKAFEEFFAAFPEATS